MTIVNSASSAGYIYGLVASIDLDDAFVGPATLTFNGSGNSGVAISWTVATGAQPGTPPTMTPVSTGAVSSTQITFTTQYVNSEVMTFLGSGNGGGGSAATGGSFTTQTFMVTVGYSSTSTSFAHTSTPTIGSYTFGWTATLNRSYLMAIEIRPYVAGANVIVPVVDVQSRRVFRPSTSITQVVSGTFTETIASSVASIKTRPVDYLSKATIGGGAWTALASQTVNTGAGTWTGTWTQPTTMGGCVLEYGMFDSGGTQVGPSTYGSSVWGVGYVFMNVGSSTLDHWHFGSTENPNGLVPHALANQYDAGLWAAAAGGGCIAFCNAIVAATGYPCVLINASVSGSTYSTWNGTGTTDFDTMKTIYTAVGGADYVLDHLGSNDARSGNITSLLDGQTKKRNQHSFLRGYVGATMPIFIVGTQRAPLAADASAGASMTFQRAAELIVGGDTYTYFACLDEDFPIESGGSQQHVAPGYPDYAGIRTARAFLANILSQSADWIGPKPASVAYVSAGVFDVTFTVPTLASGATSGLVGKTGSLTGITGFRVWDSTLATERTVTDATIISPTKVRLTVTGGVLGDKATYFWGVNPDTTNCLYSNGATVGWP